MRAVIKMHAFLHWTSGWGEDQHPGPNLSYPHVKPISCDAISALNSNISFRWSISTSCLTGPDEFRPQVCLRGENGALFLACPLADLWTLAALITADAWWTHSGWQGQLRESLQKKHHSRRFPSSFYVLWFPCPSSFITDSPPAYTNMLHKCCRLRKAGWGGGLSNDAALTQVCVMWFAELLLPTKAQLEPRLVWPAQGVSVLQGGEGIAGVAVCDEAKIVPGGGNIAVSQSLNEIRDEIHTTSTQKSINVVGLPKSKTQWTWRLFIKLFCLCVNTSAPDCPSHTVSCSGLGKW